MPRLKKDEDFTVDEKAHAVPITEAGVAKVEKMLGVTNLYDQRNIELTHQLNAALKAWNLFHRDQQYIVKDGEVIIVDEFTGRLMYGRRYSDGIHQAIEAKEGIKVRSEDQTLATITFQNYFRLYDHLAGMTGTAKTEEREFRDIYGLDVVVIPTNMPMARKDNSDIVYKSEKAKFDAVVDEIIARASKRAARCWSARARSKSASCWRRCCAAKASSATCSTPSTTSRKPRSSRTPGKHGAGDDRDQHGRPRHRHQARRGRCRERRPAHHRHRAARVAPHRQPAARPLRAPRRSRLDALLRLARRRSDAPVRRRAHDQRSWSASASPTSSRSSRGWSRKSIERAQSKVENHNYEIRKHVLEYDDVMNKQREIIYGDRRAILRRRVRFARRS